MARLERAATPAAESAPRKASSRESASTAEAGTAGTRPRSRYKDLVHV